MGLADRERQLNILDLLQKRRTASVAFLARRFGVSGATIRRDLMKLQDRGHITKTYGGAIVSPSTQSEFSHNQRLTRNIREKQRIGKCAAERIQPGSSIFLDSGTTALQIAENLKERNLVTVVTNGLTIAQTLGSSEGIQLYVVGGRYRPVSCDMVGPTLIAALRRFAVDIAFISVDGFDPEYGMSAADHAEAEVARAAMGIANQKIIIADSSKGRKRAFAWICSISEIDGVISDTALSKQVVEELTQAGVEVELV